MAALAQQEQILSQIITKLKNTSGLDFFHSITEQLYHATGCDYAFIARLDRGEWVSKTISLFAKGQLADNFDYDLRGTPCEEVACDATYVCPTHVVDLFPKDELLVEMNIDGYLGAPLHSSKGEVFGIVVALYEHEIENAELVQSLFELFSGRIAAEIERTDQLKLQAKMNEVLEQKVKERTAELEQSLSYIQQSQEKIIEQERLASLGRLVAGVAHEINTPLGVAVLTGSNIKDVASQLSSKLNSQTLSKSGLHEAVSSLKDSSDALNSNLNKAVELIDSFKQVAAVRSENDLIEVELSSWLQTLFSNIEGLLNKEGITLKIDLLEGEYRVNTYPSKLSQVMINLVENVIKHAYVEEHNIKNRVVTISSNVAQGFYEICFEDNGSGIDGEHQDKVVEPFFTTKRHLGSKGLGLSIVNSIVSKALDGELTIESTAEEGTCVRIKLPM